MKKKKAPLNRVITNILKLTNPNEKSVAFKVKTTAPKRYCVRPNTGLIHPKETVEVQILLNPSKDKPTTLSAKDKFQVQSFFLKDDQISLDLKELVIYQNKLKFLNYFTFFFFCQVDKYFSRRNLKAKT